MILPANHRPSDPRTGIRMDVLATRLNRPRAAVLSYTMQWGLGRRPMETLDQGDAQGPVRYLSLSVDSELYQRVQQAATATGMKVAPWLRHMVRHVTITDFPASWQEERSEKRSRDSHTYDTRFMLRLDEPLHTKLQQLVQRFDVSKADVIRQLIVQAAPEDFPSSCQMRAAERRDRQPRR